MFGPIIAKPGSSRKNKTGSWRMGMKPKFLKENCIGCNFCVLACPEGCVFGQEKNAYDCDFDYCKGCGICERICPRQDIKMVPEK